MPHDVSPAIAGPTTATASPPTTRRRRWLRFAGHFLLMLAAMYLGMLTLYPAYDLLAGRAGYANPTSELPMLSALVMAGAMTLPMAALMLHHRHGWRPITEMAAAMVVPTLLAALLHLTGTISAASVMSVGHVTMIPAMLAVMLLRFDHYAGADNPHFLLGDRQQPGLTQVADALPALQRMYVDGKVGQPRLLRAGRSSMSTRTPGGRRRQS